jgi:serine/threonine protein kinase
VLKELHERHIVHRDVKPENVLLVKSDEDGCGLEVTLTDFGLARILHGKNDADEVASSDAQSTTSSDQEMIERKQRSRAYTCVGSDFYTAPEVSSGLGYDTPVDIYSLGVTLYVMLCGTPPSVSHFNHSLYKIEDESRSHSCTTEDSTCDSEESGPATPTAKSDLFPSELNISPLAQDFVCKLIHPDPDQRIKAADALKHEWITQYADDKTSALDAATESSTLSKTRSLSTAEAEALLKLPIQGSMYEIAPPVLPPANSPKLSPVPTPPPVSVTLASVCSKLAPILEERRHGKNRRHMKSPRKHSRGAEEKATPVSSSLSTPPKKVRTEQQPSSAINSSYGDPTCSRIRIFGHS